MTPAPVRAPCARHRRRLSVSGCVACGAAMCSECVVHTPVGFKCTSCTTYCDTSSCERFCDYYKGECCTYYIDKCTRTCKHVEEDN